MLLKLQFLYVPFVVLCSTAMWWRPGAAMEWRLDNSTISLSGIKRVIRGFY